MNNLIKLILILSLATLTACSTGNKVTSEKKVEGTMTAQKDSKVKASYKGTLEDGTVFDQSKEGQPLEFVVGSGQLIKGFDDAVVGMRVGEEKTVKIPSTEAYGDRNDKLIQPFPKSFFPPEFKPEVGAFVTLQDQMGRPVPGQISEIGEEEIKIDLNHPLAGKALTFEIKVESIE